MSRLRYVLFRARDPQPLGAVTRAIAEGVTSSGS
jgi:hypothetical protein